MSDQLFIVAGTSQREGVTKVRFANDMTRVKNLVKGGHLNVDLLELPRAMTKAEIVAYMIKMDFAQGDAEKQAAINAEAKKRKVETVTKEVVKAPTKAKPKATAKTVDIKELDDAPF